MVPHVVWYRPQEVPHRSPHDGAMVPALGQRLGPLRGDPSQRFRRVAHRREFGRSAVIFPKIAQELAVRPFRMRFSEKARQKVRNRVDPRPKV